MVVAREIGRRLAMLCKGTAKGQEVRSIQPDQLTNPDLGVERFPNVVRQGDIPDNAEER